MIMKTREAKFCIGQLIHNAQFRFRGVIIDVDHCYTGTDEWYRLNAPHHPPKNEPWYHILVHNSGYRLYSAESNIEQDSSNDPVNHPEIDYFFKEFKSGFYLLRKKHE